MVKKKSKVSAKKSPEKKVKAPSRAVAARSTTAKAQEPQKVEKSKENRQAGARVPVNLLVDYPAGGSYLFDFCKDLGEGGIFIQTPTPQLTGTTIELTFTIPDSKETLSTRGTVIWSQPPIPERPELTPGMGVQFNAFSSESRAQLVSFVERYTSISRTA